MEELSQLESKFSQLNTLHMFLSFKGYVFTTSMLPQLNISMEDIYFFIGLRLIKLSNDEILFYNADIKKRKKDYKEQVILYRNELFKKKVSARNTNPNLFIQSTIESGKSTLPQKDFFLNSRYESMNKVIEQIKKQEFYKDQIVAEKIFEKVAPSRSECKIDNRLDKILKEQNIHKLYSHQCEAIQLIRQGENVIVSTSTNSGKSLVFQILTIEKCLKDECSTFLYIFPTKALANDQLKSIRKLLHELNLNINADTYDGDTLQDQKSKIRDQSQIIFTNPDMLHCAILPHHEKWKHFLANLKFVVLDECHIYDGTFGGHVMFILKRLNRICAKYNNLQVQCLGFSATINNAANFFEVLTLKKCKSVEQNQPLTNTKHLMMWNPPFVTGRRGSGRLMGISQASELAIFFAKRRIKTLVFTQFRRQCEQLHFEINKKLKENGFLDYCKYFSSYRAGYKFDERRLIESRFKSGDLICVVSTNALELGIDIGGIDVVIHLGFPGFSSYIQQLGRAGRRNQESLSLLVANGDHILDQYWMNHPNEFFELKLSDIIVDYKNPSLQWDHAACAAAELPLSLEEYNDFIKEGNFNHLIEDKSLYYYNRLKYDNIPQLSINIRGNYEDTYKLMDKRSNTLIEEIEEFRAFFTLYPGCIHLHLGSTYLIDYVNHEDKFALMYKTNTEYYTRVDDIVNIDPEKRKDGDMIVFGVVKITCVLFGYSKYDLSTNRMFAKVEKDPVQIERLFNGCWMDIPMQYVQKINSTNDQNIYPALHSVSHAVLKLLYIKLEIKENDMGCECRSEEAERKRPARLIFYSKGQSGSSNAEHLSKQLKQLLLTSKEVLRKCKCDDGCPNCIQSEFCRTRNGALSKNLALRLLDLLFQ
eukprot:NODE_324_length_9702_cov_1.027491.p1 type:complete len:874 gc:universal NODE_324_length_9702_cov_1.027491:4346-1725(-)